MLSGAGSLLNIAHGITPAAGSTNSVLIEVTGRNSTLDLAGSQTIDNVFILLGSSAAQTPQAHTEQILVTPGDAGTVTFGPDALIQQNGLSVTMNNASSNPIVFGGELDASFHNGVFGIDSTDFTNTGAINSQFGDLLTITTTDPFVNNGTVTADGGSVRIAGAIDASSTGSFNITNGGSLFLHDTCAKAITFVTTGGMLALEQPNTFSGEIDGLAANDVIDIEGVGVAASATYSNHTITLKDKNNATPTATS